MSSSSWWAASGTCCWTPPLCRLPLAVSAVVSYGGLQAAAVGGQLLERLAGYHHCAGTQPGGQLLGLLACRHQCADYHLLYGGLRAAGVG